MYILSLLPKEMSWLCVTSSITMVYWSQDPTARNVWSFNTGIKDKWPISRDFTVLVCYFYLVIADWSTEVIQ